MPAYQSNGRREMLCHAHRPLGPLALPTASAARGWTHADVSTSLGLLAWHKRKNTQTMTTKTRQLGTHICCELQKDQMEKQFQHTLSWWWGPVASLITEVTAYLAGMDLEGLLDGTRCQQFSLWVFPFQVDFVRRMKRNSNVFISLLLCVFETGPALCRPWSWYIAKTSFELLVFLPLPSLVLRITGLCHRAWLLYF